MIVNRGRGRNNNGRQIPSGVTGQRAGYPNYGIPLDKAMWHDLDEMGMKMPVFHFALQMTIARVLGTTFTFSIPALGKKSNSEMNQHIAEKWMPQMHRLMFWHDFVGLIPVFFKRKGVLNIPFIPDMSQGHIFVDESDEHDKIFYWMWNNRSLAGQVTTGFEPDKSVYWVRSRFEPTIDGKFQSPVSKLLDLYRSLRYARLAQDRVVMQQQHPVHILERRPTPVSAKNDHLQGYSATLGDVVGAVGQRYEQARQAQIDREYESAQRRMTAQKQRINASSNFTPLFWTDLPQEILYNMDTDFPERCIPLGENLHYVSAARPEIVVDYEKMHARFNLEASVTLGFPSEIVFPTGSSRKQDYFGAKQFMLDNVVERSTWIKPVIRSLLYIAYKDEFDEHFDLENAKRRKRQVEEHDVTAVDLFPNIDIQVDLNTPTVADPSEIRQLWLDGGVSKQYYIEHMGKAYGIPMDQVKAYAYPDGIPKELLNTYKADNLIGGKPSALKKPKIDLK